jgi:hypothetical protein
MRPPDDALRQSLIHQRLVELQRCNLFYTTNYDDFIERSFHLHNRPCKPIVIEAHMGNASETPNICEIVKFHGDLSNPGTMVISESHYEKRLTLSTIMDYRFRADVLNRALLFIGYSFRDWNVSYLFRLINDQLLQLPESGTGRRAYIVVPNPSDFETQLFRARNIEVIPVDGANLTEDIASLLEQLRV